MGEHPEIQLATEERDAWFEYLEATRGQDGQRYVDVEAWAWARLAVAVRAIQARRKKLVAK